MRSLASGLSDPVAGAVDAGVEVSGNEGAQADKPRLATAAPASSRISRRERFFDLLPDVPFHSFTIP